MAIDSLCDSVYLNNGLGSIANAVRNKTGKSAFMTFPDGFVTEIGSISGGGGEAFAFLKVTYTEGGICSVSNGTTTITAEDTSGYYVFVIPTQGMWTVTLQYEGESYTRHININNYASVYELEIIAWDGWIFNPDNGGDQTYITGGWERGGTAGTLSVTAEYVAFKSGTSGTERMAKTVNPIDLYEFNTLKVRAYRDGTATSWAKYRVGISTSNLVPSIVVSQSVNSTPTDYEIDISELDKTQKYYVVITDAGSGSVGVHITSCQAV